MRALSILLGLMLMAPLTLLILIGLLGILMSMGSTGTPGATTQVTPATLGEISIDGRVVLAGWATQAGCLLSAVLGFYLLFRRARFSKSEPSSSHDEQEMT